MQNNKKHSLGNNDDIGSNSSENRTESNKHTKMLKERENRFGKRLVKLKYGKPYLKTETKLCDNLRSCSTNNNLNNQNMGADILNYFNSKNNVCNFNKITLDNFENQNMCSFTSESLNEMNTRKDLIHFKEIPCRKLKACDLLNSSSDSLFVRAQNKQKLFGTQSLLLNNTKRNCISNTVDNKIEDSHSNSISSSLSQETNISEYQKLLDEDLDVFEGLMFNSNEGEPGIENVVKAIPSAAKQNLQINRESILDFGSNKDGYASDKSMHSSLSQNTNISDYQKLIDTDSCITENLTSSNNSKFFELLQSMQESRENSINLFKQEKEYEYKYLVNKQNEDNMQVIDTEFNINKKNIPKFSKNIGNNEHVDIKHTRSSIFLNNGKKNILENYPVLQVNNGNILKLFEEENKSKYTLEKNQLDMHNTMEGNYLINSDNNNSISSRLSQDTNISDYQKLLDEQSSETIYSGEDKEYLQSSSKCSEKHEFEVVQKENMSNENTLEPTFKTYSSGTSNLNGNQICDFQNFPEPNRNNNITYKKRKAKPQIGKKPKLNSRKGHLKNISISSYYKIVKLNRKNKKKGGGGQASDKVLKSIKDLNLNLEDDLQSQLIDEQESINISQREMKRTSNSHNSLLKISDNTYSDVFQLLPDDINSDNRISSKSNIQFCNDDISKLNLVDNNVGNTSKHINALDDIVLQSVLFNDEVSPTAFEEHHCHNMKTSMPVSFCEKEPKKTHQSTCENVNGHILNEMLCQKEMKRTSNSHNSLLQISDNTYYPDVLQLLPNDINFDNRISSKSNIIFHDDISTLNPVDNNLGNTSKQINALEDIVLQSVLFNDEVSSIPFKEQYCHNMETSVPVSFYDKEPKKTHKSTNGHILKEMLFQKEVKRTSNSHNSLLQILDNTYYSDGFPLLPNHINSDNRISSKSNINFHKDYISIPNLEDKNFENTSNQSNALDDDVLQSILFNDEVSATAFKEQHCLNIKISTPVSYYEKEPTRTQQSTCESANGHILKEMLGQNISNTIKENDSEILINNHMEIEYLKNFIEEKLRHVRNYHCRYQDQLNEDGSGGSYINKVILNSLNDSSEDALLEKLESQEIFSQSITFTPVLVECATMKSSQAEENSNNKFAKLENESLRNVIDDLSKNKSLICQSAYEMPIPEHIKKLFILQKIADIFSKLLNDIENDQVPVIQVRDQRNWQNCSFTNNMLVLKPVGKAKTIKIKSRKGRRTSKFSLIIFIIGKITNLLINDSSCTKRELYYEIIKFIEHQIQVNNAVDSISCLLEEPPWDFGILATNKGLVYGDLTIVLSEEQAVNCNIHGGSLIPQDQGKITKFISNASFILIVEKDSIFQKLLDEDLPNALPRTFIMITGKGFSDVNTRLFIKKLWQILSIPVLALVDADPYGIEIMLTYRFGSLALSHLPEYLAVPSLRWIGIHPHEIIALGVSHQPLTIKDKQRIRELLKRPYIDSVPKIKSELEIMLAKNCKAEIEGVMKSNNYLRDFYIPRKLYAQEYF